MLDVRLPLPEALAQHREQIAVLTDAGLPIPTAWRKLDQRLTDYLELQSPALTNLINNVIHPDASDDRAQMRALALAEEQASFQSYAAVTNAVVAAVLAKLRDVYAPTATAVYQKASDSFNEAAQALTACASVIDPELAAETVVSKLVGKEEPAGVAWQNSEKHAARLNLLVPVVSVAASLAGIGGLDVDAPDDTIVLPLVCDPADRHRRRIWEAWYTQDGRTGRWGALLKAGATLRACPLAEHAPYREPRPLEHKQVEFARGQYRNETIDPEDNPGHVEPIDPRKPAGRVVFS